MSDDFNSDYDAMADEAARAEEERQAEQELADRVRLIRFAMQVETEERSALWQAIMAKANAQSDAAIQEFLECDPNDVARVKELQWRAALPRIVAGWLHEMHQAADAALKELREAEYAESQPR